MRPGGVVLTDPPIHCGLRGSQIRERHLVVEQLAAQRAVEPLDLAGGSRMPGPGQPVDDAVVAADPVEQHLPALPETISKLLAIVGEHFAGTPNWPTRRRTPGTPRPVGRATTWQITQYREWSSTPVTIFASVPPAKNAPPTMSICHNAIGASRSQRT